MSLLDIGIDDPDAFIEQMKDLGPMMDDVIAGFELENDAAVKAMRDGITPYIALGLTNDHLDALFTIGLNFADAGDFAQAQMVFWRLTILKSYDHRFWYAFGTTLQMQTDYAGAVRAYLMCLGLQATFVDGYLRMGECLLAGDELTEALESFQMAQALCHEGHGQDAQTDLAQRMIAHTNDLIAAETPAATTAPAKGN